MSPQDAHPGEPPEVVVWCQERSSVVVRFADRYFPYEYGVGFSVTAQAAGLHARIDDAMVWEWDDDLARFLAGLAADFRGWDGERAWQSKHLSLRAAFQSRGYVSLTWTLRSQLSGGKWEMSITTWQEAGEQMKTLAADLRHFLGRPPDDHG